MDLWIEFTRPRSWTFQSFVIRLFTRSKFSHCRCRLVYNDKSFVFETNPPKARYMDDIAHERSYSAKVVIIIKLHPLTSEEIEVVDQFIQKHNNKKYDWPSVLKIGLIKLLPFLKKRWVYTPSSNLSSFFCSELCLALIEEVKGLELATYDESISPQRLFEIIEKHPEIYTEIRHFTS